MPQIWNAHFQIKRADIFKIQDTLWDAFDQISVFGDDDTPLYEATVTYQGNKDEVAIIERLSAICANANIPIPTITFEQVPDDIDWLQHVYDLRVPIEAGRFFIHGGHVTDYPKDKIEISINAATAFGTGEHGTTKGCLLALDILLDEYNFKNPLDMGCGSGVLAIALAKVLGDKIVAIDHSEEAVRVTCQNAAINGVEALIETQCGDGFHTPLVGQKVPYDLVMANILAQPLIQMAPDLVNVLAEGGFVILSGLLQTQEAKILEIYTALGLKEIATHPIDEWQTLVLQK